MKKTTLVILYLAFSSSVFASSNIENCKDGPLYGYGKLFHNGTTHTQEEIYPLKMRHRYNTTRSIKGNIINQGNTSHPSPLEIIIHGTILDGNVIINVSANNKSKEKIIIPKKNITIDGSLSNPVFSIISECIRLDYTGQIVNFGSVYEYPEDYVTIEPNHKYDAVVSIGKYYHFLPGAHKYEIFIPETPFSFRDNKNDNEFSIQSNTIYLTIKGPPNN